MTTQSQTVTQPSVSRTQVKDVQFSRSARFKFTKNDVVQVIEGSCPDLPLRLVVTRHVSVRQRQVVLRIAAPPALRLPDCPVFLQKLFEVCGSFFRQGPPNPVLVQHLEEARSA